MLREATVHKGSKNYDAAIACLREAYVLMEGEHTTWGYREYFRLPRCLHLAGRYDEALAELQLLSDELVDRNNRRKAAGFHPRAPIGIRNIRAMIKREIEITTERERKIKMKKGGC